MTMPLWMVQWLWRSCLGAHSNATRRLANSVLEQYARAGMAATSLRE
jgi:hypothetical protein